MSTHVSPRSAHASQFELHNQLVSSCLPCTCRMYTNKQHLLDGSCDAGVLPPHSTVAGNCHGGWSAACTKSSCPIVTSPFQAAQDCPDGLLELLLSLNTAASRAEKGTQAQVPKVSLYSASSTDTISIAGSSSLGLPCPSGLPTFPEDGDANDLHHRLLAGLAAWQLQPAGHDMSPAATPINMSRTCSLQPAPSVWSAPSASLNEVVSISRATDVASPDNALASAASNIVPSPACSTSTLPDRVLLFRATWTEEQLAEHAPDAEVLTSSLRFPSCSGKIPHYWRHTCSCSTPVLESLVSDSVPGEDSHSTTSSSSLGMDGPWALSATSPPPSSGSTLHLPCQHVLLTADTVLTLEEGFAELVTTCSTTADRLGFNDAEVHDLRSGVMRLMHREAPGAPWEPVGHTTTCVTSLQEMISGCRPLL
jgi:hypothetical protein